MRTPLTTLVLLLAVGIAPGRAQQGAGLRWESCFADAASRFLKVFACDTNTGTDRLIGSFRINAETMQDVTGNEIVVDLFTGTFPYPSEPSLPEWWMFRNAGSCRQNALSVAMVQNPALDLGRREGAVPLSCVSGGRRAASDFSLPPPETPARR